MIIKIAATFAVVSIATLAICWLCSKRNAVCGGYRR